jgi:tetratricopeptide (TPR) repeat protein
MLQQGERPRQSEETRAAQRALDEAERTDDEAQAQALYQDALTNAQAAIAADETNPLGHLQAGIAAMGLGRYTEADSHLDRAEQLRPIYQLETEGMRERAWIDLYQQAAPLVNDGDYEGAAAIFEDANAIYDKRPEVMITLGQIYAQLQETDKALENLNRAEALIADPAMAEEMDSATVASWKEQGADIPLTKASVLATAGRYEEAVGLFEQLVAENPSDITLKRNLAAILIQTGNTTRAFEVYDDLLAQPGLSSLDFYAIGVGFYQASEYGRAAEAFGGAANRAPMDRDALEMWARSLQIDSAYAGVPVAAECWIALDPNSETAYLILAQAVNQMGDGERASDLVRTIEALEASVKDLQMVRMPDGGARVTGSVTNKSLAQGSRVTLTFTFFDTDGASLGTQAQSVTMGAQGMAEVFDVVFTPNSPSTTVNGYGYTLTTG